MKQPEPDRIAVAIVDYGLGNLFSVKHACENVGLEAAITSSRDEVLAAGAVILPGVGAFGDAMAELQRLDLVGPLRDIAQSGKPLLGICLGMQLLMTESYEFGRHRGLGILEGPVVRFEDPQDAGDPAGNGAPRRLKVPQVGWNRVYRPERREAPGDAWSDTPLANLRNGEFMYFVHSFYARPKDASAVLATSRYGHIEFCSSVARGNIFACQFHPERSGPQGLQVYRNLAALVRERKGKQAARHA